MAHDRSDMREGPRGDRSRWRDDRYGRDYRGRDEDRGFFERAGDEIASWFGDDEADRRRREDQRMEDRGDWNRGDWNRGDRPRDDDRQRFFGRDRNWENDRDESRGFFPGQGDRSSARSPSDRFGSSRSDYRPMTGDYSGGRERSWRGREPSGRDERSLGDPHYHSWRQRQLDDLDRDYEDYRRENQAKFEDDFGRWRERRQAKRGLLVTIREHMEVIGSDDSHVGTVDRVAGDRIILAKSDPDSGGAHHSLSCSDVDRVEGDRVILECSADEARNRWRDESRGRALFEREDQGEMGDRMLDRSFEGTYR